MVEYNLESKQRKFISEKTYCADDSSIVMWLEVTVRLISGKQRQQNDLEIKTCNNCTLLSPSLGGSIEYRFAQSIRHDTANCKEGYIAMYTIK